jgi:hypothetical protein
MFESLEGLKNHKESEQAGGRRRRSRRGSRKARRGSKKRTAGNWIGHVKKYAKDNNMSFKDAMSSAACRSSYKKM